MPLIMSLAGFGLSGAFSIDSELLVRLFDPRKNLSVQHLLSLPGLVLDISWLKAQSRASFHCLFP